MVQLKYTWVIDNSVTEIKNGDTYGKFKVDGTDPIIQLKNDVPITLNKAETIDLMGEFKFQVADSDELRIYPLVEYELTAGETNEISEELESLSEKQTEYITETISPTVTETLTPTVTETISPTVTATVQTTKMPPEVPETDPIQSTIPVSVHNLPGFEIMLAMSSFVVAIYFLHRKRKKQKSYGKRDS
jgi:hypothetical protein